MSVKRHLLFKTLLVAWSLALIVLTGSVRRNGDSNDETLAERLIDAQNKALFYKHELGREREFSKFYKLINMHK